jgi:hypothetical protein
MGHSSTKIYDQSYASRIVETDALSAFLGHGSSKGHADYVEAIRSISHRRDGNAPQHLTCAERRKLDEHPDMININQEIELLTKQIQRKPTEYPMESQARQSLYNRKREMVRAATSSFKETWFSQRFEHEAQRHLQLTYTHQGSTATPPSPSLFSLVRHLMPERSRLADTLHLKRDLRSDDSRASIQDLLALCVDDHRVAYRPDKRPVNGLCPITECSKPIAE